MRNFRERIRFTAGAVTWMFILGSIAALLFLFSSQGTGGESTSNVIAVTNGTDGPIYDGFGLTYSGALGTLFLWGQILFVAASGVLSTLPFARLRRIGHVGLIAWAALWEANHVWVGMNVPLLFVWSQAFLHAGILVCVVLRAVMTWTPKPRARSAGKSKGVSIASLSGGVPETQ